ncbi:MAG: TolC family protein [candidate division Zixibacteria bacterium]|nr:TolC family protein [candidate division Zixibacteria bacterium]
MTKSLTMLFLLLVLIADISQAETVLDNYVNQALQNNLALQQQQFSFEESIASLKQVRGMFLPSLTASTRYTRAGGGRAISFPIGDLINPIHQSLNQLLGQPAFPGNLENEQTSFLRKEEQETKLRLAQPIFQPRLYYNYKIASNLKDVKKAERDVLARQLVAEVKTAYFRSLAAVQVVELLEKTQALLDENLRVSQSLYDNQKVTREVIYRAEAELSELTQSRAEANKNMQLAAAYFNFLLNRQLDAMVEIMSPGALPVYPELSHTEAVVLAGRNREELRQVNMGVAAAGNRVKLSRMSFVPGVSFLLDYGVQGDQYRFKADDDFWMASLVLEWNLFNGFQDKYEVRKAKLERRRLMAQLTELEKQIQLQVREAYDNLIVAQETMTAASDRVKAARSSFDIVESKYHQGLSPQIEYLDARTTMTQAEINQIITTYNYHIRYAELERVAALFPINIEVGGKLQYSMEEQ